MGPPIDPSVTISIHTPTKCKWSCKMNFESLFSQAFLVPMPTVHLESECMANILFSALPWSPQTHGWHFGLYRGEASLSEESSFDETSCYGQLSSCKPLPSSRWCLPSVGVSLVTHLSFAAGSNELKLFLPPLPPQRPPLLISLLLSPKNLFHMMKCYSSHVQIIKAFPTLGTWYNTQYYPGLWFDDRPLSHSINSVLMASRSVGLNLNWFCCF